MANISHFTQTVNGVSTTYDIHDANAVDLTNNQTVGGNKEFTGTTTAHDLVPSATDTYNLGTSTNKWKSINSIAPDELGLPTSTFTDVSSYITNFDYTGNTFIAPASGLFYFYGQKADTANLECALLNNTKGYGANFTNFLFNNVRGSFPVEKGDSITVVMPESVTVTAKIFHLKGKV